MCDPTVFFLTSSLIHKLMNEIFLRLNLKGKSFQTFDAVTEADIEDLFSEMQKVDPSLQMSDTSKEKVSNKGEFQNFLKTHCVQRQYMFSVKKCDDVTCTVCLPPILPNSVFSTLHQLPDPIPNGEHYKTFDELYGTETTEIHLPSLREKESKGHKMPFSPSGQTARNTNIFLICSECTKPRLLHSQRKLKNDEILRMEIIIENVIYTCGADIHNIIVEESERPLLEKVFVRRNLVCKTIIELPYYSVGYDSICIHCGSDDNISEATNEYPICAKCTQNKKVGKKRRAGKFAAKE